ncbi:MAG: transcriptional repressor [Leptospiraceae bacterium]|nr:transcriptional repressor [Leptospiraceae bacterium]MDW8307227.1 Fur family transcriptional regulator [Leptospiraceae bacterium]
MHKGDVNEEMALMHRRMAERGYKSTPQRDEIARWVFQTHDHFTVEDILEDFRKDGKKISQATCYRVIQMLLQLNLLIEHDFGRGVRFYEHTPGHPHHDHIICNECGQIFEFQSEELENLKESICQKNGFSMTRHNLSIYANCNRCTPEEKAEKAKKRRY